MNFHRLNNVILDVLAGIEILRILVIITERSENRGFRGRPLRITHINVSFLLTKFTNCGL